MYLGSAEQRSDIKNVVSTLKNGSHRNFLFTSLHLKYAAILDSRSSSLGVRLSSMVGLHNLRWRRVYFPYSHSMEGRFAFTSHGNLSASHKQHADTPKQGLHSPQMFLNLDESQGNWHCLKQARRPFGSLRPGLRG